MNERNTYIAITRDEDCLRWLSGMVAELGEVVPVDTPSIERILQLSDAVGCTGVFVQVPSADYRQEMQLIESLVAAKPFLPILILSSEADQNLLLTSMRLGVRDFIQIGSRPSEVIATLRRLLPKDASALGSQQQSGGRVTAIISARPASDAPMLALHLALASQNRESTLLLDLGVPHGDAMLYLGLTASYSFIDAVRSLRRIDSTLIQTGFGRHTSGLSVLSMPEEPWTAGQFSSADVYVLLRTLRQHFQHIVINIGGMARAEFMLLLLANIDRVILLAEQSVPSCRQNLQLLKFLRDEKVDLKHAGLIVDRYLPQMPPDAESIAQSFGLPLLMTLPPSGMARLATMNSGQSMFEIAPKDGYTLAVQRLAHQLVGGNLPPGSSSVGLWQKLRGILSRS